VKYILSSHHPLFPHQKNLKIKIKINTRGFFFKKKIFREKKILNISENVQNPPNTVKTPNVKEENTVTVVDTNRVRSYYNRYEIRSDCSRYALLSECLRRLTSVEYIGRANTVFPSVCRGFACTVCVDS
jgi:hypothetical protein